MAHELSMNLYGWYDRHFNTTYIIIYIVRTSFVSLLGVSIRTRDTLLLRGSRNLIRSQHCLYFTHQCTFSVEHLE